MRVLLAPGPFDGALSAPEAAQALADGWASAAPRDALDLCPLPRDLSAGAGAAGAGAASRGADREGGPAVVADAGHLARRVGAADLVVTGEGCLDATSLVHGVCGAVAALAQQAGVPCLVLAGEVHVGRREAAARGVDEAHALADLRGPSAALASPAERLRALAEQTARQWSGG